MTEAEKENIMLLRTGKNVFLAIAALLLTLTLIGIWQRFFSRAPTPTTSIIVLQGAVYYRIHPEVADVFGKVTTEKTNAPTQIRDTNVNASGDQLITVCDNSFLVRKNGTTTVIPHACSPEFAPDGKYFAYIGEAANGEGFVRIRKTDSPGSDIRGNHQMSADADRGNTQFVWSSDGQQIAVLASGDNGKIFIYDTFGQDPGKEIDFNPVGNEHDAISLVDWVESQS